MSSRCPARGSARARTVPGSPRWRRCPDHARARHHRLLSAMPDFRKSRAHDRASSMGLPAGRRIRAAGVVLLQGEWAGRGGHSVSGRVKSWKRGGSASVRAVRILRCSPQRRTRGRPAPAPPRKPLTRTFSPRRPLVCSGFGSPVRYGLAVWGSSCRLGCPGGAGCGRTCRAASASPPAAATRTAARPGRTRPSLRRPPPCLRARWPSAVRGPGRGRGCLRGWPVEQP